MSEIVRIANPPLDKQNKKKKSHTASTESTASNTTIESNSTTSPISPNENAPIDNAPFYSTVFTGLGTVAQNTSNFFANTAQNTSNFFANAAQKTGNLVGDTAQNTIEFVNNTLGVPKQIIKKDSRVLVKYMKHKARDWFPAIIIDVDGRTLPEGVEGTSFYIGYLDGGNERNVPKDRICLLYPDFTEQEEKTYEKLYIKDNKYYDFHFKNVYDDNAFDNIKDPKFRSYIIRLKLFNNYREYFGIYNAFNIERIRHLSKEHYNEMRKVLIKGGKSRKHRKSHKHTKSRKQRKSRKHRK